MLVHEQEVVHPQQEAHTFFFLGVVGGEEEALVRGRGLVAHQFEFFAHRVVEEAGTLRDARHTFQQAARRAVTLGTSDRFGVLTPVRRHLDPDLAIDGRGQESSFHVSCDEFAAMLGSHSEQSANSDVFGDWGESVVEVDALFHELTFDHHSCFVLV